MQYIIYCLLLEESTQYALLYLLCYLLMALLLLHVLHQI